MVGSERQPLIMTCTPMNIFIFEHVCGGGMVGKPLPTALAAAGRAMLQAAIEDFDAMGARVVTSLDRRMTTDLDLIAGRSSQALDTTVIDDHRDVSDVFDTLAKQCDKVLVIAPESNGILEHWVRRLSKLEVPHLGCGPTAVSLCSDKLRTYQCLHDAKVPTPPTWLVGDAIDVEPPFVVKPRHGAGCEDTWYGDDPDELLRLRDTSDDVVQPVVQSYVEGLVVSVSFMVHGQHVVPLLSGRQYIAVGHKMSYQGGRIPLESQYHQRAVDLGAKALYAVMRAIDSEAATQTSQGWASRGELRGFVGVDLVLSQANDNYQDVVIEINPRLTVSYVALRRLCQTSLAAAMLHPLATIHWLNREIEFEDTGLERHEVHRL